eukprot:762653-Hanusia_phi.AAC.4
MMCDRRSAEMIEKTVTLTRMPRVGIGGQVPGSALFSSPTCSGQARRACGNRNLLCTRQEGLHGGNERAWNGRKRRRRRRRRNLPTS